MRFSSTTALGSSALRSILGVTLGAASLFAASAAHAQGATQQPAPMDAPAAPGSGPLAPPPAQGPVQPIGGASELAVATGNYTCTVGEYEGFESTDARTTAMLICRAIERKGAPSSHFDVRLDKLGGKILLSVTEKQSGDSREMLIQGFDEVPIAAERLVTALIDKTTLAGTETVGNVGGQETRTAKLKPGQVGFDMGVIGMSGAGTPFGVSAGVGLGLIFRLDRLAVTAHGRAGGIGSNKNKIGFGTLDVGGRYYFGDEATAPFAGGGLQFGYFNAVRGTDRPDLDGSGLAAFGEVGVEALRTGRVGLVASLRVDAPFFELGHEDTTRYDARSQQYVNAPADSRYVLPLSLNVGLVFR